MKTSALTAENFLDWRENSRRQVARAVLLSILLHVLLIALVALLLGWGPAAIFPFDEEEPPTQFTLVPPPPEPPQQPAYLETTGNQRSPTAPEKPAFESDKDTRAASESPATGTAPLPSQEGEESPATAFENREYTAGKEPHESAAEGRPATPAREQAAPQPTPRASGGEIALLQPLRPQTKPIPKETPQTQAQPQTQTQPTTPSQPGYQSQTRVTRLRGNISNRGRAAADAAATPLGRYKKQISDAIGSRWYYDVNRDISLLVPGTIEIRFIVRADGRVEKVTPLRNSSNESFASVSVGAILQAEIPPIPEELLPLLKGGSIEVDFTFSILPN